MERTIVPVMVLAKHTSGDMEVINMNLVRRIRFRKTGAVIVMEDGNLAEVYGVYPLASGPNDRIEGICSMLNAYIERAMKGA